MQLTIVLKENRAHLDAGEYLSRGTLVLLQSFVNATIAKQGRNAEYFFKA